MGLSPVAGCRLTTPHKLQAEARWHKPTPPRLVVYPLSRRMAEA
jgi:hypothetical protein